MENKIFKMTAVERDNSEELEFLIDLNNSCYEKIEEYEARNKEVYKDIITNMKAQAAKRESHINEINQMAQYDKARYMIEKRIAAYESWDVDADALADHDCTAARVMINFAAEVGILMDHEVTHYLNVIRKIADARIEKTTNSHIAPIEITGLEIKISELEFRLNEAKDDVRWYKSVVIDGDLAVDYTDLKVADAKKRIPEAEILQERLELELEWLYKRREKMISKNGGN